MKRYIKSSSNIVFHSVRTYSSYEDYCYSEMQSYYDEQLTDEDYEDEFSEFNSKFSDKFGDINKLESVVTAYIGFVPFAFVLVDGNLYQIGYDRGTTFTEVTKSWLNSMGCITSLDEIYALIR